MSTDRVLIAGAGPVGLATAYALARRDVPVTVLEQGDGPGTASRASTFHPPSLEFLRELEVVDDIEAIGLRAATFQLRDRQHGIIAEYDLGVLADDTDFPYRVQCEQSKLCVILADRLAGMAHVELRWGHAVTRVEQDPGSVLAFADTADGEVAVAGTWLVGADGAHSAVRESLGIVHEGITYPEQFLVISTPVDLRELLPDLASVNYISDPDEWLVLLQTPDHWRVLFPIGPDEDPADVTSDVGLQARLNRVAPRDEPWPILQHSHYEIHQRVAERFRDGRVLLAGDAAHLNNPLGGLGMNSGLADAWSLSTRLANVWHGQAGDDTLDTYAALRREVALEVVDRQTRANKRRLEETSEDARAAHHAEQARIAADPTLLREHLLQTTLLASTRTHL